MRGRSCWNVNKGHIQWSVSVARTPLRQSMVRDTFAHFSFSCRNIKAGNHGKVSFVHPMNVNSTHENRCGKEHRKILFAHCKSVTTRQRNAHTHTGTCVIIRSTDCRRRSSTTTAHQLQGHIGHAQNHTHTHAAYMYFAPIIIRHYVHCTPRASNIRTYIVHAL